MAATVAPGLKKPDRRGRIRVVVRVRPTIQEDLELPVHPYTGEGHAECVSEDAQRGTVQLRRPFYDTREFSVDGVLSRHASQSQTYDAVARGLVDSVLEGFNGTILAYGQSGTGKTHTIYGPLAFWHGPSEPPQLELSGIIPRSAAQIFAHADAKGCQLRVTLASLQIYQETVSDLLCPPAAASSSSSLLVREDPTRGIYVEGLTEVVVESPQQVLRAVQVSATNRATVSTAMNRCSSRSHAMLLMRVEQWERAEGGAAKGGAAAGGVRVARRGLLSVVDLAGSERVSKSGSEGTRLDEAKRINKSIAALGNCIAALAGPARSSTHVPFRDSKLTRLLTDSLGGKCAPPPLAPRVTAIGRSGATRV